MNVPALASGIRFRRTPQGQGMLLIPEGVVTLNNSAAAIVELIDGHRTVDAIAQELRSRFDVDAQTLGEDIEALLERMQTQNWLEATQGEP